jgi:hypothetical protein
VEGNCDSVAVRLSLEWFDLRAADRNLILGFIGLPRREIESAPFEGVSFLRAGVVQISLLCTVGTINQRPSGIDPSGVQRAGNDSRGSKVTWGTKFEVGRLSLDFRGCITRCPERPPTLNRERVPKGPKMVTIISASSKEVNHYR